ncbi:unnamed protein product [Leptidea sinapis]|uniref:Uncharacterized protein n=1 Tax=Leptidea sinapis TaxID=189913 RepID=A0A5E4QPY2_9NEOP|nr:unnamed protein product [Leptidea sinapis]
MKTYRASVPIASEISMNPVRAKRDFLMQNLTANVERRYISRKLNTQHSIKNETDAELNQI